MHEDILSLITEYAQIRIKFEEYKKQYPEYLEGNDNYIGIIGEYWAKRFLESQYPDAKISGISKVNLDERSLSSKWVDFTISNYNRAIENINVKTISCEAKSRTSGPIKFNDQPENGISSAVIVKLGKDLYPEQVLYIHDLNGDNLKDGKHVKYKTNRWKKDNTISFQYYKEYNDTPEGFDRVFDKIYTYKNGKFKNIHS